MSVIAADTAIIGGGLMGCWTALLLRRRKPAHRVVVLEKGVVGAQASGVNYGNLRIQGRHPGQLPLAVRAAAIWETLPDYFGEDCEFEACGHLYAARDDAAEIAKVEKTAAEAARHGVPTEVLDASGIAARWPWLKGFRAASWSPSDAVANPRLVTPALARAAREAGAEIIEGARANGAVQRAGRFRITTEDGRSIEAGQLVNAAGAWATDVAGWFAESAPIVPAGPPQFVTDALPRFIRPSVQAVDGSIIFRQTPQGQVVAAGYPRGPSDPVANRAPVDPRRILAAMGHLLHAVPRLHGARLMRVWSGIEAYLPDMLPIIGPSMTTPGLWHAFGFCGHGFQISPGVGAVLADLLLEGTTPTPLDLFGIARFAAGPVAEAEQFRREFDHQSLAQARARRPAQEA